MSEYKDFTSLPPDKEQEFVIYEKTSVEAGKKAKVISLVAAASFLALVMGIVFSFDPPKNKMAEDDLGALAAPKTKKAAEKKPAAQEEAPKAEGATAEQPAGEGAAAGAEGDKPAAEGDKPAAEGDKPEGE